MANIIPMAGKGSRFQDSGYSLPKPLIPVSGRPMIINVIRSIPKSDKWIFIVLQEHIDEYEIDTLLKKEIQNAIIIPISKITEGQASTCLLAESYLKKDEPVLIGACDNSSLYNTKKYESMCSDKKNDSIVWTFTKHETLKQNPNARGWCVLENDGKTIKNVSVKKPISNNPFNDHAIVATFFFKHAEDFLNATKLMIKENFRINNEFYMDAVPIFMNKLGKKSVIFDIDYYLDWGYPQELYKYQKLEYLLRYTNDYNVLEGDRKPLSILKKYFSMIK